MAQPSNCLCSSIFIFAAQNQNITVGVSFGATRELAFLHAETGNKIYFPQVP